MSTNIQILDINGRSGIGHTSPHHPGIVWAHPASTKAVVADSTGITGVAAAKIMTDTAWHIQADGTLLGRWYDSKLGSEEIAAKILPA